MSDEKPITHDVRIGYLGWSNGRSGLEFYRADGQNNRWLPRENPKYGGEQPVGRLLQDDIEQVPTLGEGCVCVVITMGTRDIKVAERLASELVAAMQRGGERGAQ